MDQEKKGKGLYTRRQILKGIPIGIAGAVAAKALTGGFLTSMFRSKRRQMPDFPEDSIFAPARDRYTKT